MEQLPAQQPGELPPQEQQQAEHVPPAPPSFLVRDKYRRINSIEYFKKGIQPKWEDPKNENGGRFVFPVNKNQENKDDIYTNLVFYLLGEDFNHSERINGFRFISPKNAQSYYRVEIWVDFDDKDMEILRHFEKLLTELFKNLNFDSRSVKFLNNRADPAPKDKETK